jgi:hypothetical protein
VNECVCQFDVDEGNNEGVCDDMLDMKKNYNSLPVGELPLVALPCQGQVVDLRIRIWTHHVVHGVGPRHSIEIDNQLPYCRHLLCM